ncbi:MAG: Mrp family chromosome partitioning ATPase, partial [Pirellulaceae bacterium]
VRQDEAVGQTAAIQQDDAVGQEADAAQLEPEAQTAVTSQEVQSDTISSADSSDEIQSDSDAAVAGKIGPTSGTSAGGGEPVGDAAAEWEVDEFLWATACQKLMEQEEEYFLHAGRRLADTTREGVHVLAVTGSQRGEGRTTLAMCLARCAAAAGVRVAMVDADLQRPSLGRRLGVDAPCSWQDVLLCEAPLGETIVYSEEDRISLVPLNDTDEPHMKLDDDRVTRLIDALSKQFDLVVIDCGPLNDFESDFFERGSACPIDAAIVVRDLRASSAAEVYRTVQQLRNAGVPAVGIAENFAAEQAAAKAA